MGTDKVWSGSAALNSGGGLRLALVGKKAAGQAHVALYLKRKYHFKSIKLQHSVDRIIQLMYGLDKYARPAWEKRLAIYDALYKVDNNIHISYLEQRLKKTTMEHIVVDDPRYINEIEALIKMNFIIVRVTSTDDERKRLVGKGLRTAAEGSIKLAEYFNIDPSKAIKVSYNILNTSTNDVHRIVDDLMKKFDVTA